MPCQNTFKYDPNLVESGSFPRIQLFAMFSVIWYLQILLVCDVFCKKGHVKPYGSYNIFLLRSLPERNARAMHLGMFVCL